jgi:hypothetical protein
MYFVCSADCFGYRPMLIMSAAAMAWSAMNQCAVLRPEMAIFVPAGYMDFSAEAMRLTWSATWPKVQGCHWPFTAW